VQVEQAEHAPQFGVLIVGRQGNGRLKVRDHLFVAPERTQTHEDVYIYTGRRELISDGQKFIQSRSELFLLE
jgi:hypothetical protein